MELRELVPSLVLATIREQLITGVADAEANFEDSEADEDSLTGALGQSIARSHRVAILEGDHEYVIRMRYRKVRGRGRGAPERPFGADGIFQIEVLNGDKASVWRKGLPFQSKKRWFGTDSRVVAQARKMINATGTGLVIDYSESGYRACPATVAIEHGGRAREIREARQLRPLGQVLGNDFLECRIGAEGLYFDPETESFEAEADMHLIETLVQRSSDPRT
jgi:hypothetical protein